MADCAVGGPVRPALSRNRVTAVRVARLRIGGHTTFTPIELSGKCDSSSDRNTFPPMAHGLVVAAAAERMDGSSASKALLCLRRPSLSSPAQSAAEARRLRLELELVLENSRARAEVRLDLQP